MTTLPHTSLPLSAEVLDDIRRIAAPHGRIFLFGSRAKNTHRPFSDIDLCIINQKAIPDIIMASIKEQFQESDIPFKVDVVDFHSISNDFQKLISREWMELFTSH